MKSAPNYNFPIYRQLVHEISETFKKISNDILIIEQQLRGPPHNFPIIAEFISKIQDEERLILELVCVHCN